MVVVVVVVEVVHTHQLQEDKEDKEKQAGSGEGFNWLQVGSNFAHAAAVRSFPNRSLYPANY